MSNSSLLDIDDTLLSEKFILPENGEDNELSKLFKQFDSKPFIIVKPMPGICLKTRTETGDKLFLNICTTPEIPPPEDISEEELLDLFEKDEPPNFRIPMSIGEKHWESDKGGSPCETCDVAINTQYFEKCQKIKSFWLFNITVILEAISVKFNVNYRDESYVILKHRKVMGKLQDHRIEKRNVYKPPQPYKTLVEEISVDSTMKNNSKKFYTHKEKNLELLDYVILKEPEDGEVKRLIGLFNINKMVDSSDVSVHVNSDRIVVCVEKYGYVRDIFVSYEIDKETVEALLDKDMRVLRLNMPVITI